MTSIRNTTLLYRPSLSIWTARKLDKSESEKVNQSNGAVAGAANVHKQLLPDSKELLAVQKWANSFRTFIYTSTSPWDDAGWRIRSAAKHMEFMAEVGDRLTEGDLLVDGFVSAYLQEVVRAEVALGHMFRRSDYPGEQEVRTKFKFVVDVMPVSSAEDFRVVDGGIPQSEVDRLIKVTESSVQDRIQGAMGEAYEKLYQVVAKMANTLEQYGAGTIKKFNDSLVENIVEIVGVMPALNLTGDPHLNALADDAKQLANYSVIDLRKSDTVRDAAINDARNLATKFKGFVSASVADTTPVPTPVHKPVHTPVDTPVNTTVSISPGVAVSVPSNVVNLKSKKALFADML
jgi:hypothetical protein